jgi:hypothetical protein
MISCQNAKPARKPWQNIPIDLNIFWLSRPRSRGVMLGFRELGWIWLARLMMVSFLWLALLNPDPSCSRFHESVSAKIY